MHYIGIRGHRGAGKTTISYLLGHTIDYILENKSSEISDDFNKQFNTWVDEIVSNESAIYSCQLKNVYFDSFSDTLKIFLSMLIGCDTNILYSDYNKDHMIINIRDFSYEIYEEIPENIKITSKDELFEKFSKFKAPLTITKNIYITLRDFILYFGVEIMQRYFGLNVWIKCLQANEKLFENIFTEDGAYKIYIDVKTPSELTYIYNKDGVIVKVNRPGYKKKSVNSLDKLSQDNRFDYGITIKDSLYKLNENIFMMGMRIVDKFKNNQD